MYSYFLGSLIPSCTHSFMFWWYMCTDVWGHYSNFSYNLKLYESELLLLNLLNSKRNIWNLLLVSLFQLIRSAWYWVTGVWNSFPILIGILSNSKVAKEWIYADHNSKEFQEEKKKQINLFNYNKNVYN